MSCEDIWEAIPQSQRRASGISLEHISLVLQAQHTLAQPAPIKELTDEEFAAKTKQCVEDGFPDLAPCCKKEDRGMDGWCKSCGDPCF